MSFLYDVFLCHSSKDKPIVRKLAQRLMDDGLRVWFDEWEIQPGDLIGLKVEEALQHSRVLILMMSSNAFDSDWVKLERHTALFRDPSNRRRRFIPVRLDDVEIPDTLRQFAHLDWRSASNEAYLKLLKSCEPPTDEPPNSNIRYSPSFSCGDAQDPMLVDDTLETRPLAKLNRSHLDTKPLIGVNIDYRSSCKDSPAYCFLHAGYCNSLLKAGAIPIVLPPVDFRNDIQRVMDFVDGLLFIGGNDLDCRRDGYMLHPSMRLLDKRREEYDRQLMAFAADRCIPVMGVGCGMQLLNVSQGGTLFRNIPEDLPRAVPHFDAMDPNHRHGIEVKSDTLMSRVYGDGENRVNSMHHMAIDDVASGFATTAWCPDGIIEAIESTNDNWFAFGVQFHPEHESASVLDLRVFYEFVAGINKIKK